MAVTLTRSAAGWRFYGPGKIALNGQSIADAIFDECYSVYGTSTGDDASFYRCQIGSGGLTLDHSYITACRIKGAITLIANADPTIFHDCIDATGSGADFELIFVANATAVVRNFQGALTLKSMAATNSVVIDGALRVTIDESCTAGSITVRGFAPALTGAAAFIAAGGTITQDARYSTDTGVNVTQISGDATAADRLEAILDATPSGAVVDDNDPDPSATAFETNLTESTNDHYNGTFVLFYSGALLGQSRKVSDYDGTSKVLTVAAAFTEAPAAGDTFIILGRSE